MSGKLAFVLMSVFLDNSHFINRLRHYCPFLYKIKVRGLEAGDRFQLLDTPRIFCVVDLRRF
jgi:hypothetical protein